MGIQSIIEKQSEYAQQLAHYQSIVDNSPLCPAASIDERTKRIVAQGWVAHWQTYFQLCQYAIDLYNGDFSGAMWQESKNKNVAILRHWATIESAIQMLWQNGAKCPYSNMTFWEFLKVHCTE